MPSLKDLIASGEATAVAPKAKGRLAQMLESGEAVAGEAKGRGMAVAPVETLGASYADMATGGHGDELGGFTGAAQQIAAKLQDATGLRRLLPRALQREQLTDNQGQPLGVLDAYRSTRDENKTRREGGQEINPGMSKLGKGLGFGASLLAPVPGGAFAQGAMLGGLHASGNSEADLTRGEVGEYATDTGFGAAVGGLGGAVLDKAIRGGGGWLAARAGKKAAEMTQRIDDLGKATAGKPTATARSEAGTSATAAYKNPQNIEEAIKAGAMTLDDLTPEAAALYKELLRERGLKAAKEIATDAARKTEKGAAYREALATEPARAAAAAKEIGNPLNQIKPVLKRYALPIASGLVGSVFGGPVGFGVGALAGRGASPTVNALLRRAQHPSIQRPLWRALEMAASGGAASATGINRLVAPEARRGVAAAKERLSPLMDDLIPMLTGDDEEENQKALVEALRRR